MSDQPNPELSSGPVHVAAYVASHAGELAILARKSGLTTLRYLLDMVRLEAENLSRPTEGDERDNA